MAFTEVGQNTPKYSLTIIYTSVLIKLSSIILIHITASMCENVFCGELYTQHAVDMQVKGINYRQCKSIVGFEARVSGGSRISCRGCVDPLRGCEPLTWALFGENVCKNERIGSRRGTCARYVPP